jgi:putative phosphoribosyl transferase
MQSHASNREVTVSIPVAGGAVAGTLGIPAAARGIIVFVHATGSSRSSARHRYLADRLRTVPFATLLIDLLSTAEEELEELSGEPQTNVGLFAERVVAVSEWLRREARTSRLELGYLGNGAGAAAALAAAARIPRMVGAVVCVNAFDPAIADLGRIGAPTLLLVEADGEERLAQGRLLLQLLRTEAELALVTVEVPEPDTLDEILRQADRWFRRYLTGELASRR